MSSSSIKISVGVLTLLYALFILSYPASFFNDDSLFLAKGVENFSVIDFSPHFPGYPFIVICGKIVNIFLNNSKLSLFVVSSTCAIALPLVIFLYTKKLFNENIAFISFLLCLSSPYLINLSLSMLSDSVGLFFFFLGLYLLKSNKNRLSAVVLAISLFSRPSYFILFFIGFIYLSVFKKESLKEIMPYFTVTSFAFLLFIYINNGNLYFYEAKRFIEGHFLLWGRGQNSETTWFENIVNINNILYITIFYSIFTFHKKLILIYLLSAAYFFWIIFAQNPDSLRHLIPLIFMLNIIICKDIYKSKLFTIIFLTFNILTIYTYKETISPIDQIINSAYIKNKEHLVISNRSIEILRQNLSNTVVDKYYSSQAEYIFNNFPAYAISANRPKNSSYNVFNGRFIGEKSLYLSHN